MRRPRKLEGDVCIFVTLARGGVLQPHSLFHMQAWHAQGWQVVLVVILDDFDAFDRLQVPPFAEGVLLRRNRGYDFGAWAAAICRLQFRLQDVSTLATVNDSIFGPFDSFVSMLERVHASDADVIGTTDSFDRQYHFQSYLLFFKRRALRSVAFKRFWLGIRTGGREFIIERYELKLLSIMRQAGLRCVALFSASPDGPINPTLGSWRNLIEAGFPYIKVDLLRTNPHNAELTGWRQVLKARGYDERLVRSLIATTADERAASISAKTQAAIADA